VVFCSGQRELCTPLVRGRRELDGELTANPEPNIFSLLIGESTQIMHRKFLGIDCFHFCRIPVELSIVSTLQNVGLRSPPQMRNARITSYSWCAGGLLEADSHVGL
jgi:hypothetical protein